MKKRKTVAGQLAWWTALPLLLLTACALLLLTLLDLRLPTDDKTPRMQLYLKASVSPDDKAAFDRELYANFANHSDRDALRVCVAATDAGEVIFREHIGYEIYLSERAMLEGIPDRFLVLDRLPLQKIREPPTSPDRIFAKGENDGFYFYADSMQFDATDEITASDANTGEQPSEPDIFSLECSETQYAVLAVPEFVWRKPKSPLISVPSSREDRWEMYLSAVYAASEGPVFRAEEAFTRPRRKSVFGSLVWQETTCETIYASYLPRTRVHVYTHIYERPLPSAMANQRGLAALLLFGCAALTLYVYAIAQRLVAQPLTRATEKAARLSDPDSRFWPTELDRPDEFGDLNRAMKQAEDAFQKKWDDERALEQKRQDFVAAASHDLKTPLALIGGYAEAVQQNIDPAENARYLDSIEREAAKMNRLVLQMLDYTRLDRMETLAHGKWERLDQLVGAWLDEAAPLFEGWTLKRSLSAQTFARCDAALLRRAVDNLLSNAAKFTPPGGTVQVSLTERSRQGLLAGRPFTLAVENDGEPIPEAELERIFEMFYRTDRARTRGEAGNGVGLASAKRICELHGFTLRAENTRSGVKFVIEG